MWTRVDALRVGLIAKVFTLLYAVLGFVGFASLLFARAESVTFPIGLLFGNIHLNLNFNLTMPVGLLGKSAAWLGVVLSMAASGALTGIAFAWAFNVVSRFTGGFEARLSEPADPAGDND